MRPGLSVVSCGLSCGKGRRARCRQLLMAEDRCSAVGSLIDLESGPWVRKRECKVYSEVAPGRSESKGRCKMLVPLAVVGGLFAVGFGISRLKELRERKPDVQTLFRGR